MSSTDKRKTVCVDLDATLAVYNGWNGYEHIGAPIPGAREFLAALQEDFEVVIWSTRNSSPAGIQYVDQWLAQHQMPHDGLATDTSKPVAIAFVDHRAVSCRPQESADAYADAVEAVRTLGHRSRA